MTASSPRGTFSPAELTADRVITRFITPFVAPDGKPSVPRPWRLTAPSLASAAFSGRASKRDASSDALVSRCGPSRRSQSRRPSVAGPDISQAAQPEST